MQSHINGVGIRVVLKFLAENWSKPAHTILVADPFEEAHTLIIPLK